MESTFSVMDFFFFYIIVAGALGYGLRYAIRHTKFADTNVEMCLLVTLLVLVLGLLFSVDMRFAVMGNDTPLLVSWLIFVGLGGYCCALSTIQQIGDCD